MTTQTTPANDKFTAAQEAKIQELLGAMQAKMQAEYEAKLANAKAGPTRTIKLNSSGGVFVRDSLFRAWSASKQKHYIASANIPMDVAQHLFGKGANPELVAELGRFVDANKPQ